MSTQQRIAAITANLSEEERTMLLAHLLKDTAQRKKSEVGIVKTAEICGGSARIARTRIPVRRIVEATLLGISEADTLLDFPTLRKIDIENAMMYYARNRSEIDAELVTENER